MSVTTQDLKELAKTTLKDLPMPSARQMIDAFAATENKKERRLLVKFIAKNYTPNEILEAVNMNTILHTIWQAKETE